MLRMIERVMNVSLTRIGNIADPASHEKRRWRPQDERNPIAHSGD